MKNLIITSLILAMFATCTTIQAQNNQGNYLGLPGDNLNLFAVMKLFQESETLEGFEKNLNAEESRINNLDLNGDNYVDYISVIDYVDDDVHNIVMQVAVNAKEKQDVATFTVQRFNNGQVQIQLIGDEALYGKDYIIEPNFDEALAGQTPNPGYSGNSQIVNGRNVTIVRTTTYELASWPIVRYIYLPTYVGWRSSWYYGYYPSYWQRWRPHYYHYYYGYHHNLYNHYYGHYRYTNRYRYSRWNDYYYHSRRSHSPYVSKNIHSGYYKTTYSRPEQRKDGEALYSKTYQSPNNRRTVQSTGSTSVNRRSDSQAAPARQAARTGTSTTRRSTTTVTNRSATNPTSGQKASPARRSTSNVSRSTGTSNVRRSTGTSNVSRSTGTSNSPEQNYGTPRRSTSSTISRSGSKSNPSPNASPTRTPRRSTSTSVSSSSQRSSGSSKSTRVSSSSRRSSKSTSAKTGSSSKRSSGSSKSTSETRSSSSRRR